MSETTCKVAVVQTSSSREGTEVTVAKAVDLIAECGQQDVEIAVFPEAFIGGYPKGADFDICIGTRTQKGREEFASYWSQAINVPGPETAILSSAVSEASLFAVMGVIERDNGTLYCTILFFGPTGELLGKHRKTMPTGAERLCWGFGDASTMPVVESQWGNIGAVICWENYMPLLRMAMYDKGLSFYCAPTADDRDTWAASMQHIALEGRCFVLSACQYLERGDFSPEMENRISDDDDHVLMRGGSLIVDPMGQILAGPCFGKETILTATVDVEQITEAKFDFDVVGHYSRPDLFTLVVDERKKSPVSRS